MIYKEKLKTLGLSNNRKVSNIFLLKPSSDLSLLNSLVIYEGYIFSVAFGEIYSLCELEATEIIRVKEKILKTYAS